MVRSPVHQVKTYFYAVCSVYDTVYLSIHPHCWAGPFVLWSSLTSFLGKRDTDVVLHSFCSPK